MACREAALPCAVFGDGGAAHRLDTMHNNRVPFFEGVTGAVYYRSWTPAHPRAVLVFLHGLGQNSANYHRFARLMNDES